MKELLTLKEAAALAGKTTKTNKDVYRVKAGNKWEYHLGSATGPIWDRETDGFIE